jgi:ribosomal protein S19E (S16A)
MQDLNELSRRELLVLKEIGRIGRTADRAVALQLLNDGMVAKCEDGRLQLSPEGRRMLLRGSPSLWEMAS